MGQMGMTLGLALYDDLQVLQRALKGDMATSWDDPKMTTTAVDYNEAIDINSIDLFYIEQYQWEIASPEAYKTTYETPVASSRGERKSRRSSPWLRGRGDPSPA